MSDGKIFPIPSKVAISLRARCSNNGAKKKKKKKKLDKKFCAHKTVMSVKSSWNEKKRSFQRSSLVPENLRLICTFQPVKPKHFV